MRPSALAPRPNPSRAAVTAAATVLLAGIAVAVPASASAAPCPRSHQGIVATLGVFDDGNEVTHLDDGDRVNSRGVETLGTAPLADPDDARTVAIRVTRRNGRTRAAALCRGTELLARLPRPDPRTRFTGLSANGRYVAWRTSGPGRRGSLSVGRLRGRRIVAVRRTSNGALRADRRSNGRILVMPDGTAAWSLPDRGRAGVWLWPRGTAARRVGLYAEREALDTSVNVRIVDDRHVLLLDQGLIARYGPATPGRCPEPTAATPFDLGSWRLFSVTDPGDEGGTTTVSSTSYVACDPAVGDYVKVFGDDSFTNSQYGQDETRTRRMVRTANVVVSELVNLEGTATGAGVHVVGDDRRHEVGGALLLPGGPAPKDGANLAVVPGAVAWVQPSAQGRGVPEVWLSDANGTRAVGTADPQSTTARVALSRATLSWSDAGTTRSTGVSPVPDSPVVEATVPR